MGNPQATRRSDLQEVDHAKVIQTRRRLVDAFRDAAREQRMPVSVTWVCDRAGVARSTFYTHFGTVDDLAVFSISQAFAEASDADVQLRSAHEEDRRSITRAGLERVVDAFEATSSDIDYAIRIGSRAAVIERLTTEFALLTRRTIATELDGLDERARDLMAEFIGAGTVHVVFTWMERGRPDRDLLIERLIDVLPAGLTR